MFPIPWNKAYRKKDGTVVNISDAMTGGGGGGELPQYSSEDAGKVLTVNDEGQLEWDEAGAGGGEILNYSEVWTTSGGDHSYSNDVEIVETGKYDINFVGYANNLSLKVNDTALPIDISFTGDYAYWYVKKDVDLNAGDIVHFLASSSGRSGFIAQIFKK